ncbi:MAG: hypothetical protein EOP04_13400 [Proteobacteria bacterium]|nr:MAG: hypothetical protein EOP04_13400 [Pseudomonadota bacterium]
MPISPELHGFCLAAGCTFASLVMVSILHHLGFRRRIVDFLISCLVAGTIWSLETPNVEVLSFRTLLATLIYGTGAYLAMYGIQTNISAIARDATLNRPPDTQAETKNFFKEVWNTFLKEEW